MSRIMMNAAVTIGVAALVCGCFGPSDADQVDEIRSDFVLMIEGKDRMALIRHCPDDLSELKISMESGGYVIYPDSLDELEEALDEFRATFNGEKIEVTQENVDMSGASARVSVTFKVSDNGWVRILPVRLDMEREDDRWILRGLHVFD